MAFYAFYVIAIAVLVLHFSGWLARNNLDWVVLVLAVAIQPFPSPIVWSSLSDVLQYLIAWAAYVALPPSMTTRYSPGCFRGATGPR